VKHIWTDTKSTKQAEPKPAKQAESDKRTTERRDVALPARLTWKDQRGTTRFATVITRNVSDFGVYVESTSPLSIPLYRLVQFQLERDSRPGDALPGALQQGRVLSAVYRVTPPSSSKKQGLALRLMVDPRRVAAVVEDARATA
jgi:hypothetical protein